MPYNNFLLPLLVAPSVQRNVGPRLFCTDLALRARSVQKRRQFDISLYRPRARLIRSYYIFFFELQTTNLPPQTAGSLAFTPIFRLIKAVAKNNDG